MSATYSSVSVHRSGCLQRTHQIWYTGQDDCNVPNRFIKPVVCNVLIRFGTPDVCNVILRFGTPDVCNVFLRFSTPDVCNIFLKFGTPDVCNALPRFSTSNVCNMTYWIQYADSLDVCNILIRFSTPAMFTAYFFDSVPRVSATDVSDSVHRFPGCLQVQNIQVQRRLARFSLLDVSNILI